MPDKTGKANFLEFIDWYVHWMSLVCSVLSVTNLYAVVFFFFLSRKEVTAYLDIEERF